MRFCIVLWTRSEKVQSGLESFNSIHGLYRDLPGWSRVILLCNTQVVIFTFFYLIYLFYFSFCYWLQKWATNLFENVMQNKIYISSSVICCHLFVVNGINHLLIISDMSNVLLSHKMELLLYPGNHTWMNNKYFVIFIQLERTWQIERILYLPMIFISNMVNIV